jgi:hypothetical protein
MADLITMLSAVAGQQGEEADEDFNQTVLLLHGDGTNGAQNNTFLDGSTNNFTITRNGNTTQGTFSPFSLAAGEWSNYFDGSGDYLSVADNNALDISTEDLTVECWFYLTDTFIGGTSSGNEMMSIVDKGGISGSTFPNYALFFVNSGGALKLRGRFQDGATERLVMTGSTTIQLNTWYHAALIRSSTTGYLFLNGVQDATGTLTGNMSGNANPLAIGYVVNGASRFYFPGYISNTRIVKGTAVYTSAFTPSTTPLTAITNTSLLTCQSNRFVDNSSNNFAITRNGDVRVTPFSPFAPTAAYSAGTNGGSGYFDGTGDYLTITSPSTALVNWNSGDFTCECWVYINTLTGWQRTREGYNFPTLLGNVNPTTTANDWSFGPMANGTVALYYYGGSLVLLSSTATVKVGDWNHIAFIRNSSGVKIFVNGVGTSYLTVTGTPVYSTAKPFTVGSYENTAINGYVSNIRVLAGTALYTSDFTPPTAPLTAISNTQLLLNFTNAGIFDNTGKNNLETVGNAQIDTTTKKFGTGSMEFDGTGDWLLMPNTPDQQLGTGNFTIEFWVYLATGDTGSARGLVAKGTSTTGFLVSLDSSQKVVFTFTTSTITSSGAITLDAWNHIAVVREGTGSNQTKIYIGGTNDGTGTVSTNFNQTSVMYVGANRTGGDPMKGFIDDLRITKGVARYTANFSVPNRAFPDL